MRRLLKILFVGIQGLSYANADFIRVEVGSGIWLVEPTGSLKGNGEALDSEFDVATQAKIDKESDVYAWANFKHFLPIIPNFRLEYATTSYTSVIGANIKFDDREFKANVDSFSLDLNGLDFIAYYNLLDNTFWTTIDVGLDLKILDGYARFTSPFQEMKEEKLSGGLPLAFVRTRIELPFTGLSVDGSLKYLSFGDSGFYDAQIKLEYKIVESILDLGIEFGYREQNIKIGEDFGSLTGIDMQTDLTLGGFFAGVQVKF